MRPCCLGLPRCHRLQPRAEDFGVVGGVVQHQRQHGGGEVGQAQAPETAARRRSGSAARGPGKARNTSITARMAQLAQRPATACCRRPHTARPPPAPSPTPSGNATSRQQRRHAQPLQQQPLHLDQRVPVGEAVEQVSHGPPATAAPPSGSPPPAAGNSKRYSTPARVSGEGIGGDRGGTLRVAQQLGQRHRGAQRRSLGDRDRPVGQQRDRKPHSPAAAPPSVGCAYPCSPSERPASHCPCRHRADRRPHDLGRERRQHAGQRQHSRREWREHHPRIGQREIRHDDHHQLGQRAEQVHPERDQPRPAPASAGSAARPARTRRRRPAAPSAPATPHRHPQARPTRTGHRRSSTARLPKVSANRSKR